MAKFTGFVARVGHKTGQGRNGTWHLYSVKLEKEDGSEHPWISLGFKDSPPKIQEGEYIALEANEDDNGRLTYVDGTATKPKNPPVRKSRSGGNGGGNRPQGASGRSAGAGGAGRGNYQPRVRDGSGINDRTNPEDAKRMSYSSARTAAIEVIGLLLEHKALPGTSASGKAAEAKRFAEILAAIDKLTVEYFNDGMELRKLHTVADAGAVNTAPDAELPADVKEHAIDGTPEGDDDSEADDGQEDTGDDSVI